MRSFWNGMISFGLVNIPVRLYVAVDSREFELNYLHSTDLCPVQYKKVCRCDGKELSQDEIVKGYEYQKGDYIVLSDEDFKQADVKKSQSIEIEVFVNEDEIDPVYIEKPYFLEPDKKAHNVYALFRDAMSKAKKVGVGKLVLKNREHLVVLKPQKQAIILIQLRFAELMRDVGELDLPGTVKVPGNQMELALELIKKLEGTFKPADYKDTYTEELRQVIEAKKKGKPIRARREHIVETRAEDLISRLRQSLVQVGRG